jgi:4,4'-diaponeurosporenoate glycosyltransferase
MIVSLAIVLLGLAAGVVIFGRLRTSVVPPASPAFSISIIIPARNEEKRIGRLLESLRDQSVDQLEIIVVDDASTDDTAQITRSLGATVIPAGNPPEGWLGKPWACQRGADNAHGQVLLFLDADTWFEADGVRKLAGCFTRSPGVLSVAPCAIVSRAYEQLSAYFNLLMIAGSGAFTLASRRPDGLFGQALMIEESDYRLIEGHSSVKHQILENLWLGRELVSRGITTRAMLGRGVLNIRMYPDGVLSLCRGWSKAFANGATATAPFVLLGTIVWIGSAITAVSLLATHPGVLAAACYGAVVFQTAYFLRKIGNYWFATSLLFPVPLAFFLILFLWSALTARSRRSWKGREIHVD